MAPYQRCRLEPGQRWTLEPGILEGVFWGRNTRILGASPPTFGDKSIPESPLKSPRFQEKPGGASRSQEEPGGARRSQGGAQEEPRRSQEEPGGAQEEPRSNQEESVSTPGPFQA